MIYGLYLSGGGAKAQSWRQDIIANNIANADTTGFRRQIAVLRQRPAHEIEAGTGPPLVPGELRNLGGGVHMFEAPTDLDTPGVLKPSSRLYDLAIHGEGFFQVRRGTETYLTRSGAFAIDNGGFLTTNDGSAQVLGADSNPVRVDPNTPISIDAVGHIFQAGNLVGQLAVREPREPERLARAGSSQFRYDGPTEPASGVVKQSMLEGSNVNAISEMVDMIAASRVFETNVRLIQLQSDTLADLLQTVPRL